MTREYFLHSIRNNNDDLFLEKTTKGLDGENFNAFYLPQIFAPNTQRALTIPPRWPTHIKSTIVSFESKGVVFQGGFPRNMGSAPYFLDSQEENIPEKLKLIRDSKIQNHEDSPRAIFSTKRYFDKIDQKSIKRTGQFSSQIFHDGLRVPISDHYFRAPINYQFHDEAHIRGPLHSIDRVFIYEDSMANPQDIKVQFKNALNICQKINNKRIDILRKPDKPENDKLMNNFIDIEISRGTLALQKIALLQKLLRYHELNPTIDTNQEMQLSFQSKIRKSQTAHYNSRIDAADIFIESPENQKIWINSQKTKIQQEILEIRSEIDQFITSFSNSKDIKSFQSILSDVDKIIKKISDSDSLDKIDENYEIVQKDIKFWQKNALEDMGLRTLIKKQIISNLDKPINIGILANQSTNNLQLINLNIASFFDKNILNDREFLMEMASSNGEYDHAIINLGLLFLKNQDRAIMFANTFCSFSDNQQKSILENAIKNNNHEFINLLVNHISSNPKYSLFSALWRGDERQAAIIIDQKIANCKGGKIPKDLGNFFNDIIMPFDTPIHLMSHDNFAYTIDRNQIFSWILEKLPNLLDQKNKSKNTPNHIAAESGNFMALDYLISKGSKNLSRSREDLTTPVNLSFSEGYTNLISSGFQLNGYGGVSDQIKTPLYMAIENGHQKAAEELTKKIAPFSMGDKSSRELSLIQCASKVNDAKTLKILLEKKVTEKDSKPFNDHYSSIHFAAQHGNEEILNLLLSSSSKKNLNSLRLGKTPLVVAVINDRVGAIEILLNAINQKNQNKSMSKIDIEQHFNEFTEEKDKKYNGLNILQIAVVNKNFRALKLLLSSGNFDINKEATGQYSGLSTLDLAIMSNSFEIVDFLLKNGAKINPCISDHPEHSGLNSLHLTCKLNKNESIIKALINSGQIDPNSEVRNGKDQGKTALQLATTYSNRPSLVKTLLEMGADPEKSLTNEHKPIQIAFEKCNRQIEILLENGANFDSENINSLTNQEFIKLFSFGFLNNCPHMIDKLMKSEKFKEMISEDKLFLNETIHTSIKLNQFKMFEFVLDRIFDYVSSEFIIGNQSLLEMAINSNKEKAVQILLEKGANVENRLSNQLKPIELALSQNNTKLIRHILEKKPNIRELDDEKKLHLLFIAIEINDKELVSLLLNSSDDKFNFNAKNTFFEGFTPLQYALIKKNNEISKFLISYIDDIDFTHFSAQTGNLNTFQLASQIQDTELLDSLIKKGANINETVKEGKYQGFSALALSLIHGNLDQAKFLLEQGASIDLDIKDGNKKGYNILQLALENKDLDEELLSKILAIDNSLINVKIPTNSINRDLSPLNLSIVMNLNPKISKLLLDNGAEFDSIIERGQYNGMNSLFLAILNDNNPIANELIKRGTSPNFIAKNILRRKEASILSVAIKKNNLEIITSLLENGARFNETILINSQKFSALDFAIIEKKEEVVKIFLQHDDQFNEINDENLINTLKYSIKSQNKNIVNCLLDKIITKFGDKVIDFIKKFEIINYNSYYGSSEILDVIAKKFNIGNFSDEKNIEINNGFLSAITSSKYEITKKFLQLNIDTEIKSSKPNSPLYGSTALHIATMNSDINMMQILLTKANVNAINLKNSTPLHIAIENNNIDAIKTLLTRPDLDPTIVNADGFNAFQLAANNNNMEVLEILLKHPKVNIDSPISNAKFQGLTPLQMAISMENKILTKFLLDKGANPNIIVQSGPFKGFSSVHFCSNNSGYHSTMFNFLENISKKTAYQFDEDYIISEGYLQGISLKNMKILKNELCEENKSNNELLNKINKLGIEPGKELQAKLQEIINRAKYREMQKQEKLKKDSELFNLSHGITIEADFQLQAFTTSQQNQMEGSSSQQHFLQQVQQIPKFQQSFPQQIPSQAGSQSQMFASGGGISYNFMAPQIAQPHQIIPLPTHGKNRKRQANDIMTTIPAIVISQNIHNDNANPSSNAQQPSGSNVQNQNMNSSPSNQESSRQSKRARS